MKILLTGAAGFIGFHTAQALLKAKHEVIGIDNLNDYYDPSLKKARLALLEKKKTFTFYKADISNTDAIEDILSQHKDITHVLHLAAQAGVRYSVEHPYPYAYSNLLGHTVILEACRKLKKLEHLVYASSSSVYGGSSPPFSVEDRVDTPHSLYAATKKANELMSYSYSHLYNIPATGLRYFTVYGPWGRPDMAIFLFTRAILAGKPIEVFNHGDMQRDFTYIDDAVAGTLSALTSIPDSAPPHALYNIGNNHPEELMHFIQTLEKAIGKKAAIELKDMQPGDVKATCADITSAQKMLGFSPRISIEEGLPKFVTWYKEYYGKG